MHQKNLPYPTVATHFPFVRSRNGNDWEWPGTFDTSTLQFVCRVLGYKTYVSSTCYDDERSHRYPHGKCNFHSPSNNELSFYDPHTDSVKWESAEPKHAKTWISTLTCKDPLPECSDWIDNDGDGKIDLQDSDCDGPDDDDEDRTLECTPGSQQQMHCTTGLSGVCSAGEKTRTCNSTGWWRPFGECIANIQPGTLPENCNDGKDNDCDGKTDGQDDDCFECWPGERQHTNCSTGYQGICAAGKKTRTCNSNGWWGAYGSCQATILPGQQQEQCNDWIDNDCDGKIDGQDNNCFQCTPGSQDSMSCNAGLSGACSTGKKVRTCQNNGTYGQFGSCNASVTPGSRAEICNNGIDDDCDGVADGMDSDCAPSDQCQAGKSEHRNCSTGLPGICGAGKEY